MHRSSISSRSLSLFYRGDLRSLRIADLGCLEGGFSLALAQRGATVLGVEARAANVEKANLLQKHFALPNLSFVQADVKAFDTARFGEFDVVLALGILYHLDDPVTWLAQVAEATRGLLVVDSHFAPADDAAVALLESGLATNLGPLETVVKNSNVYEGRWKREYEPDDDPEPFLWRSYSNLRSFWLTKQSLLLALLHSGFDLVFEQHDYSAHSYHHFAFESARMICVAAKTEALASAPVPRG